MVQPRVMQFPHVFPLAHKIFTQQDFTIDTAFTIDKAFTIDTAFTIVAILLGATIRNYNAQNL